MIRVGDGNDYGSESCASLTMSSRAMRPVLLHNGGATTSNMRNTKSAKETAPPSHDPTPPGASPLEAPLDDALSRSQVSYYATDKKFGYQRDRDHGEVPEVYRTCSHIELSLSCAHLPSGRRVSYHTTIDTGNLGIAWQTEQVHRTSSPTFIIRGKLPTFSMNNSQALARSSWVRIGVWDKRQRLVGTAECRLSDVLWHQAIDVELRHPEFGTLPTNVPVGRNGMVSIAAIPCVTPPRFRTAKVTVEVLNQLEESRLQYTLLRDAPRGRWIPLARVDGDKSGFEPVSVALGDLMHGTLRLCVARVRRSGEYATIVVAQFSWAQLVRATRRHACLPRLRGANDEGDAMLRADKWLQDDEASFYARVSVVEAKKCNVREVVHFGGVV